MFSDTRDNCLESENEDTYNLGRNYVQTIANEKADRVRFTEDMTTKKSIRFLGVARLPSIRIQTDITRTRRVDNEHHMNKVTVVAGLMKSEAEPVRRGEQD